ncbi:hypothetical protein [Rubellicoccus peritrichatus]|uniref:Uncharacterized protein n=1 Tax=Rubellicoccus peritrichatus TaxID=3080537 RepID=A0AAQ3L8V6_9BACT|nr:hypothetical protein [Puniceicoccus sp. CR14]WOO39430.1 hypothetical protein RZN69_12465 [Puniceicoccus sp. CR14]
MAIRYTRKVKPDLLSDEAIEAESDKLLATLIQLMGRHLSGDHGWELSPPENARTVHAVNGDLEATVSLEIVSDMENVPNKGFIRHSSLIINLKSMNKKRVSANLAHMEVAHGFEKVGAGIGTLAIGLHVLLFQALAVGVISLEVTAFFFVVGFVIGGAIGYVFGDQIGSFLGKRNGHKSFDSEVNFGVAKADWEIFVNSVISPIDKFCSQHESIPSRPTIV